MNIQFKLAINIALIFGLLSGCGPLSETPPLREFDTVDLLLYPDLLPDGWVITIKPTTRKRDDSRGFRNSINSSEIVLQTSKSSIIHRVAVFPAFRDAARSYNDHDFASNTLGLYPITWESISDFEYISPIANQFRVVCADIENAVKKGEMCVVEAQYDEFLSILDYRTTDVDHAVDDLALIAKTVDSQMMKYLEGQPESNP
jgi:hypothetical protein